MVWHYQTGESYPMNSAGGTVAMGQALTVRSELYPCFLHTKIKAQTPNAENTVHMHNN